MRISSAFAALVTVTVINAYILDARNDQGTVETRRSLSVLQLKMQGSTSIFKTPDYSAPGRRGPVSEYSPSEVGGSRSSVSSSRAPSVASWSSSSDASSKAPSVASWASSRAPSVASSANSKTSSVASWTKSVASSSSSSWNRQAAQANTVPPSPMSGVRYGTGPIPSQRIPHSLIPGVRYGTGPIPRGSRRQRRSLPARIIKRTNDDVFKRDNIADELKVRDIWAEVDELD
ncbi:hypothetical protein C8J56DRAFT_965384 [Mycena floridula]|nr:hypothetical protein C8J56DRAFT_965384 [Mycena floridula]